MVQTLALRATQDGVIWPRRPLLSSSGLLSRVQNLPRSSHDTRPAAFRCASFNASGELLAACDERGRVFVLFVTANRYALVTHLGVPTVRCVFSPARRTELLVTCEDETVRCLDVQAQTLVSTLRGHRFPAKCVSFQRSGRLALTASQDAVILWDTKDWSRYRVLNAGPGVEDAAFVARGDLVAVCFQDDTIMMWELETLALRYRFSLPDKEPSPGLQKFAVSDDHQVLVASGRAPFIYVWDFESQTIIRIIELPPPIKQVVSHTFLPGHSTTISILADDGGIFFLDVAVKTPQIKLEITNQGRSISAFDIECHARYLAATTSEGFLLLYDMEIARRTAARVQERRRKEGLVELGEYARLRTRSGLQGLAFSDQVDPATEVETDAEQSRPVPSKLIDSLFGANFPRHAAGPAPQDTQGATATAVPTEFPRVGPASATRARVRATAGSFSVPTKQALDSESPTLREKVRTRRISPLARPHAQLTAQEVEVNRKRLVGSLKCNGTYPKKYRVLVWRFLLRLPKNEEAFRSLVAKGKHPVFVRLKDQYPLQDSRIFRRLHRVLSAIVYWCPAFGEVSYLPAVVYPFVKIFRENDLAAFEASVSVLLHWCGDFLISLPYPPVFAMSAIEKELARRDAQLHDHFTRYQVTSEAFAWSLLQTVFTEVLSEDEWLCLWDHLLTCSATPQLLFVAVLAYLSYFRTALLAACDRFSIEQFFHQQNAIDVQKFVQLMMNMRDKLDLSEFTAIEEPADANAHGHGPYWPLSRGQYPAFAHYPRFVVDFQISERNRIALEEAELAHKQTLLDRIEEESASLKAKHDNWMTERKMVLQAEERRRREAIAAEKERILHLKTLDYETRRRRLQHLSTMESSAHETLEEASKMLQTEHQRLESTLAMQKERMAFEISSRKQEEDLQRVEFETHDRVHGILKQREMEERLSRLRTEFETRVKQQELQDLLKFESWKREDEEQARNAKAQLRRREESALMTQEKRVRQELENQLLAQQLAKEKELLELETARRARRKEQQEHAALAREVDAHTQDQVITAKHDRRSSAREEEAEAEEMNVARRSGGGTSREEAPRERDTASRSRRAFDDRSESDGEEVGRRWSVPASESEPNESPPRTPDYAANMFAARPSVQRPPSSESSMSFASASMRRTMAEMSLLEKALGNISSSVSSSHSSRDDHGVEGHEVAASEASSNLSDDAGGFRMREAPYAARSSRPHNAQEFSPHQVDAVPHEDREAHTPLFTRELSQQHDGRETTPPAAVELSQAQDEPLFAPCAVSPPQDDAFHTPRKASPAHEEALLTPQAARDFSREHDTGFLTPRADRGDSPTQSASAPTPEATQNDPRATDEDLPTPQAAREASQLQQSSSYAPRVNAELHVADTAERNAGPSPEGSDSDSEGYASASALDALQRPIAELEKKLGIRFDDFSDEEKEDESGDELLDARRHSSDEEEDETIEDDRAKLLQRAKRLLELSSFDTDSDDDL